MDKIKYLPHPCSTAEKQEWNSKGYRVVDEKFAPVEQEEEPKPKRKPRKKKESS